MKKLIIILTLSTLAACIISVATETNGIPTLDTPPIRATTGEPTVEWQYDGRRAALKAEQEWLQKMSEARGGVFIGPARLISTAPDYNDRELGYRSDGMVVWRPTPEYQWPKSSR